MKSCCMSWETILNEELKIVYTCEKTNLKRLLQCGGEPSAACFRTRVETDEFQRFVGRIILLKAKTIQKFCKARHIQEFVAI